MVRSPLSLGACAAWVGLLAAGWALGGAGDALLTPLPDAWTGPPILGAFLLAMVVAYGVGAAVPWRLPRRLVSIVVLATTVYSIGQAVRGVFALHTFGAPTGAERVTVLLTGGAGDVVHGVVLGQGGATHPFPATPELVAQVRPGVCVEVAVQTTSAAARLAPDPTPLTPADVRACR